MGAVEGIMLANAAVKLGIEVYNAYKDSQNEDVQAALAELKVSLAKMAEAVGDYKPRAV